MGTVIFEEGHRLRTFLRTVKRLGSPAIFLLSGFLVFAEYASATVRCRELFSVKARQLKLEKQNHQVSLFPDRATIDARLFAFHLTDTAPRASTLQVGRNRGQFRPTIHFALGEPVVDHRHGNWSNKLFGIIIPFRHLRPQVVGFFPQDTFTLGSVKLSKDSVLVVPVGRVREFEDFEGRIVEYGPHQKIKDVLLAEHEKLNGLRLRATRENEIIEIESASETIDVESQPLRQKFAEQVMGEYGSQIFTGHHAKSPFGMLDLLLLDNLEGWFTTGLVQNMYKQNVSPDFTSVLIQFDEALSAVKNQIGQMNLNERTRAEASTALKEIESLRELLTAEIELQRGEGLSFFHSGQAVHSQVYPLRYQPQKLREKISELAPGLIKAPKPVALELDPQRLYNYLPFSKMAEVERSMEFYFPGHNPKKAEWIGQALIERLLTGQIAIEDAVASFERWWPMTTNFHRFENFLQAFAQLGCEGNFRKS
jgi:hypothetical protein